MKCTVVAEAAIKLFTYLFCLGTPEYCKRKINWPIHIYIGDVHFYDDHEIHNLGYWVTEKYYVTHIVHIDEITTSC